MADNWIRPDSFEEGDWSSEEWSYDASLETAATYVIAADGQSAELVVVFTTPILTDKVRIYVGNGSGGGNDYIYVRAYYNGQWNYVVITEPITPNGYAEYPLVGGTHTISKISVLYYNSNQESSWEVQCIDIQANQITARGKVGRSLAEKNGLINSGLIY